MDGETKAKFENVDAEFNRVNHRLSDLEEDRKEMRELVISVKELAMNSRATKEKIDGMSDQISGIDTRLENIEKKPLSILDSAKQSAVGTIIAFIVGAVMVGLIWAAKNAGAL